MAKNPSRLVSHFELGYVRESHAMAVQSVYGLHFSNPAGRGPIKHNHSVDREARREFQHGEHFDLVDGVSRTTLPLSTYSSYFTAPARPTAQLIYPVTSENKHSHIQLTCPENPKWTTTNREYMTTHGPFGAHRVMPHPRPGNNVIPSEKNGCDYITESKSSFSHFPLQERSNRWVISGKKNMMVKPVGLDSDVWSSEFDDLSSSTTASYSEGRGESIESCVEQDSPGFHPKPLLIFDWDDTILPTSWLNSLGHRLEGPNPVGEIKSALEKLSPVINETLRVASKKGHVMIITNAEDRWIQLTAEKFLPDSVSVVNKFQHISARSMFEPTGVTHPIEWKENAFRLVVDEYVSSCRSSLFGKRGVVGTAESPIRHHRQVVSIGDSVHEREAVLKVCAEMKRRYPAVGIRCKSLKFMERPDIDSIVKQHQLIQECFNDVLDHKNDLDLCIQPADVPPQRKTSSK